MELIIISAYVFFFKSYHNKVSENMSSSTVLLDENQRALPECNIHDKHTDAQFFVANEESFNKNKKESYDLQNIVIITGALLIMFLCIFTLNFGVSGWTAGNILTFIIVVIALVAIFHYGKQWNEVQMLVSKMQTDGTPCYTKTDDSHIVHCKK